MSFLKNLFGKKEAPIGSYADFWNWFGRHEQTFFNVIKNGNIEKDFLTPVTPKLQQINDEVYCLVGMKDSNTAELVLSAEGTIKNIVFIEELISAAPPLKGWLFTALKPALGVKSVVIQMAGYTFDEHKISFYANEQPGYPDEIDITIVHADLTEENQATITQGVYVFLDNVLGELNFSCIIDNLSVTGKNDTDKELIPVEKLPDYLNWRQKEFVEKYEGVRHDTEHDNYSAFEAELPSGNPLLAVINTDLLAWDAKASHPWIMNVDLKYDGSKTRGMPTPDVLELMNEIEEKITDELRDKDGYLNVGRQTAENVRELYFACNDFRKPSKVLRDIQQQYANRIEISYEIYKDKYWQSFNRFSNV